MTSRSKLFSVPLFEENKHFLAQAAFIYWFYIFCIFICLRVENDHEFQACLDSWIAKFELSRIVLNRLICQTIIFFASEVGQSM